VDPRAARVREKLRQAAFDLIHERRVEAISVSDITQRAGVSRQVFYQHFRDRDDAVATAVTASFDDAVHDAGDPVTRLHRLCEYATRHTVLYRRLYPSAASQRSVAAFRDLLRPTCDQLARDILGDNDGPVEVLTTFLIGGIVEILRLWADTAPAGNPTSATELRRQLDACLAAFGHSVV
jgi:AcrR family transcriptional regulator